MSGHASLELLSAYLDGELPANTRRRVERHVADCPSCRTELASLRRVVGRLQHLERAAPPPILAQHVQRRIALEGPRQGFIESLEDRLRNVGRDMSVFSLFGVIIALLLFAYLFSVALERAERSGSEVIVGPTVDWAEPEMQQVQIAERTFEWHGDGWRQRGLSAEAEGQELSWSDGLRRYPWISELEDPAGAVTLRDGDTVVTIRPPRP
ncbi:MAG: anti-sigma factor [Acidobacteriota bacterium]